MSNKIVGIHLDLKYLMPRKDYLLRWLGDLVQFGVNTLLLEYEDKFPFATYPFIRDPQAFTPDELREFLATARSHGLCVIPLVQTLSHLEFALAHDELASLREAPHIPTQINIANPASLEFVHCLLDEVLEYHAEDEFIHLGGDEAWALGEGGNYAADIEQYGVVGVWARHMKPFCDKVIAHGKRPVVWDDSFWPAPDAVNGCGLPKQTLLCSWGYGNPNKPAGKDLWPRVDVYQEAGYEVVGVPCLNWGVLFPMHDHCLANLNAWAQKVHQSEMKGMINSSWSSFHTPLPTQVMFEAATRAALETDITVPANWETDFLTERYGADARDVPAALQQLGTNWEFLADGLERPITPIVYGYMDVLLHFKGGQQERRHRGVYPLDWNEVDFVDLYRRKLEILRSAPDQDAIETKLNELDDIYRSAVAVLDPWSVSASKHSDELRLIAVLARMKALHVQLLKYFLFESGDAQSLLTQLQAQESEVANSLHPYLEPASLQRTLRIWCEPALTVLRDYVTKSPTGTT